MFYMLRLAACSSYYSSIASWFTCWDWQPVCPITALLPHVLHAEIGSLFVLLHLYCLMLYMLRLAACLSYYSSSALHIQHCQALYRTRSRELQSQEGYNLHPIPLMIFNINGNFYSNSNEVITTIFSTCHDSTAVVACAKIHRDMIVKNGNHSKINCQ